MVYLSNRSFKMWAYTVSHCSLLLRSELKYFDEEAYSDSMSYNIDIEFWAVQYIDIPSSFRGIRIREVINNDIRKAIIARTSLENGKVFEIETKDKKYYVIAGGVLVGKNKWENQDRIFNYDQNLEHEEVITTA